MFGAPQSHNTNKSPETEGKDCGMVAVIASGGGKEIKMEDCGSGEKSIADRRSSPSPKPPNFIGKICLPQKVFKE